MHHMRDLTGRDVNTSSIRCGGDLCLPSKACSVTRLQRSSMYLSLTSAERGGMGGGREGEEG